VASFSSSLAVCQCNIFLTSVNEPYVALVAENTNFIRYVLYEIKPTVSYIKETCFIFSKFNPCS